MIAIDASVAAKAYRIIRISSTERQYSVCVAKLIDGESQSLSNFSEGGVAPTELPATTPTARERGHWYFESPPTGRDIPHR